MRVFISYRRADAPGHAGRIADQLVARYGQDNVFLDVGAISGGEDFADAIDRAITASDAVLVVIGPAWLRAVGADGSFRLTHPEDFVRLEIEHALRHHSKTIPVLVGGATMPAAADLPTSIAPLAHRNAVELLDRRFLQDLTSLQEAIEGASPPAKGLPDTHLPAPVSSFLGREAELNRAEEMLSSNRLVTVTGPGGTGKTRFAIELAARQRARFPSGVHWMSLEALRDPAIVLETVAQTLGVRGDLSEYVGNKSMLIVLDNFEQVIDASGGLSDLLTACPNLRAVVTSRELLRIAGEAEHPLPPLTVEEGAALFCERALVERSRVIEEICARLDNLPLAIELAAARTRILTPEQLLDKLGTRLDALKGNRDADVRHHTLRATIEWSHDLLSADEQALFARLSVFAGGCTLEAAEVVCDGDLDTLQSLFDKSLVRRTDDRLWMLETIREYAAEWLERMSETEVRMRRHLLWFLTLAEEAELQSRGGEQEGWFDRLEADLGNVRAALACARRSPGADLELRLSTALWRFWAARGYVGEGLRSLGAALERSPEKPPRARLGRCYLACMAGNDFAGLLGEAEAVAAACAGEGDRFVRVQSLTLTGLLRAGLGRQGDSEEALEEALVLANGEYPAEEAEAIGWLLIGAVNGPLPADQGIARCQDALKRADGNGMVEAFALVERAALEAMRGEFDTARTLLADGRAIFRELDLKVFGANTSQEAFFVEMLAGNPEGAAADLRATYDLLEEMGERSFLSTIAGYLAHAYYAQGDLREAHRYAERSEDAAAKDDYLSQSLWRSARAKLLAKEGDFDGALSDANEGVRLMEPTDLINARADGLSALAEVLRMAGRSDKSATALDQALWLYEQKGNLVGSRRTRAALERAALDS